VTDTSRGRTPRRLVALTFDYETWQPIPPGKRIDWDADVFEPAAKLIAGDVPVTLFAELGEYLWLDANEPTIARRMDEQWREAVVRGHDVQLHLHPSWLPECHPSFADGVWSWDARYAKADAYPGDLDDLIERCVRVLQGVLTPVDPTYRVTCFRAGAYQAQPFRRLAGALAANGIETDSSVYAGGVSEERGYDYSFGYSEWQPYFASPWDPQLRAAPAETALVELPIAVVDGRRVMLDGEEGAAFDARIVRRDSSSPRRHGRAAAIAGVAYSYLRPIQRLVNLALPRAFGRFLSAYEPERLTANEYTVTIGHTKGDLRAGDVIAAARRLRGRGYELVTLSEMAGLAREDLLASSRRRSRSAEAVYQVEREHAAVLGDERNEKQSAPLQRLIPLDRDRVLDLGCGAGHWSKRIADTFPWIHVTGVDVGEPFVAAAQAQRASDRVSFVVGDFAALPFTDESFDCVYADNTLEHAYDVEATLSETHRVLRTGGVLVAAIPSDARNPRFNCDNHTWKTIPQDVGARLEAAGFADIAIDEVDIFRELGASPFPPSDDRMMYLRAWKRDHPADMLDRAREAVGWLYARLAPGEAAASDPIAVIRGGVALCAGYAVALHELLRREGVDARIVQMQATDHPRGRGPESLDTHVVVQARLDGRWMILDAMAGTVIEHSLAELLKHPDLATGRVDPDDRYCARGYQLYDSAEWYARVSRFQINRSASPKLRIWHRNGDRKGFGAQAAA
jgi:SAM-dependent methyltransferase